MTAELRLQETGEVDTAGGKESEGLGERCAVASAARTYDK